MFSVRLDGGSMHQVMKGIVVTSDWMDKQVPDCPVVPEEYSGDIVL